MLHDCNIILQEVLYAEVGPLTKVTSVQASCNLLPIDNNKVEYTEIIDHHDETITKSVEVGLNLQSHNNGKSEILCNLMLLIKQTWHDLL